MNEPDKITAKIQSILADHLYTTADYDIRGTESASYAIVRALSKPDKDGWQPIGRAARHPRPAYWTHDDKAVAEIGEHLYYFAPTNAAPPPYKTQRHVQAIIDIAEDGTLAGVELIDDMPPPPLPAPPAQEVK